MPKLQTVIRDQLDVRCDQFEAEWKAGRRPSLRAFLAGWEDSAAEQLFRHLVELDIDYRKRAGEGPAIADYETEFPQYCSIIKEVVWQPGLAETRALGSCDTKPAFTSSPSPSISLAGYELLEVLGQGGMGIVYKARQTRLNRFVAVKMLLSGGEASAEEVQRFHVEAEAAAKLDHPHIVPIYEVGEQAGRHFFSMAYIEGPSLSHQLRRETMPIQAAAAMVRTIAEAVHYAHSQGIIHRDLKPANILLGNDGRPRISDFGLAKSVSNAGELTTTGQILGTPYYMAPEQAAGRVHEITPATDVYALGTILYEMLVGRVPFRDASVWETIQQVIHVEPVSPRLLNRSVPRDLETIVLKALDKQPSSRFASAQEFADDLGRFLHDEPILARPVSRFERGLRWARKNQTVATLLAVVLSLVLFSVAGAAVGGIIYRSQEREKLQLASDKEKLRTQSTQLEKQTTTLQEQSRAERYFTEMIQAGDALRLTTGIGRVRELVDPWAKDSAEPDLRGWEWHLLRSAAHEEWNFIEIKSQEGHFVPLTSIAFHPRAEIVAFGGVNGDLFVGPIEDASKIELAYAHEQHISNVAWRPDGARLATSSLDGKVIVWELAPLRNVAALEFGKITYAVAWSPDGKLLAVAVEGDGVHVFDAATRKRQAHLTEHVAGQAALAFSPRGDYLAVSAHLGADDYRIHLWNTSDWQTESPDTGRPERGHTQQINHIAWSKSGQQFATASFDRTVKLWSIHEPEPIHTFDDHTAQVTSVMFTRDDRELVSVGWDYSFRRFNIAAKRQTYIGRGHTNRAAWCDLNPHGDLLASVGADGVVRLWDLQDPAPAVIERRHSQKTTDDPNAMVSWRRDGRRLAASINGETWEWKASELEPATKQSGASPQWSAGDQYFAHWLGDGLQVRDMRSQEPVRTFRSPEPGHGKSRAAWSHQGAQLAVGTGTRLFVWDVRNAAPRELARGLHDVCSVVFSPNDESILVACVGGKIHAFRVANGEELFAFQPGPQSNAVSVAWSPDGKQFITCIKARQPIVWNGATRQELCSLTGHAGTVNQAAWSPDGQRIATAGSDATVRIWTADTGEQTLVLRHPDQVVSLAWSPDGKQLASLSQDGTLLVHDATLSYSYEDRAQQEN